MKAAMRKYLDSEECMARERREDLQRWQRWLDTGAHLDHEAMLSWLNGLAARAEEAERAGGVTTARGPL